MSTGDALETRLQQLEAENQRLKARQEEHEALEELSQSILSGITSERSYTPEQTMTDIQRILRTVRDHLGFEHIDLTVVVDENRQLVPADKYDSTRKFIVEMGGPGIEDSGIYMNPDRELFAMDECSGLTNYVINTKQAAYIYDNTEHLQAMEQTGFLDTWSQETEKAATRAFLEDLKKQDREEGRTGKQSQAAAWWPRIKEWYRSALQKPENESFRDERYRHYVTKTLWNGDTEQFKTFAEYLMTVSIPILRKTEDDVQVIGWVAAMKPNNRPADQPIDQEELDYAQTLVNKLQVPLMVSQYAFNLTRETERRVEAERQLGSARSMAAIGEIADSIAHEIRNPLRVVGDNLHIIGRRIKKEKPIPIDVVDQATMALDNARERIAGLEHFASASTEKGPYNLNDVIDGVFMVYDRKVTKEGFEVERDYEPNLPNVEMNQALMNDVFRNLLDNALQFSSEHKRIEVKTYHDDKHVYVDFTDYGRGIPEEDLPKVFEPRWTTRTNISGVHGVGMSTVKRIIEEHNGHISIDSKAGEYTTVCLQFDT